MPAKTHRGAGRAAAVTRQLLGRPSRAATWAAIYLTLVAAVLCAVPLFDLLAYEFCLALGIAQVPASLVVGHRAACRVRQQPSAPAWWAVRDITLALVPPLVLVLGNALRVRNCNVGHGLVLYAALPWTSACYGGVVACAATTLLRRAMPRPARAHGVALAALGLAPLACSLARLYWQPPIAAYDHLWGYFAGSIYDEQVTLTPAFWAFRAATAGRIVAAVALSAFATRGVRSRRQVWAAALGTCACVVGVDAAVGPRQGYRVDRAQLRRVLPQQRHCRGVVLHLPASLDAAAATRLTRDHAFRLAQARRRLQLGEAKRPVHSWVFADAEAKARWTGGRNTMVAKPWLGEIYLHGTATPHPLVAHELVHAVLGPYGQGPLGVPRQQGVGVGVNVGLVEGMAEAVAFAERPFTAEEVTSCLWPTGGANLLEAAMGGRRGPGAPPFWAQPGPRAYAASGAFVGYLSRRFGPAALLQIYGGAPWETATGAPLPALVADFAAALTQTPPDAATCARARASYARPSVFGRVCAHEIAALQAAQRDSSPAAALALQRRIAAFVPGDWREQVALATRLLATDAPADAAEAAQILAATPAQNPPAAAAVHEAVAGALARTGRLTEAAAQLRAGLALPCDPPLARTLFVRQWSLGQPPALREATDALLAGRCEPWRCAALLAEAAVGNDATAGYLLGRQLFVRDQLTQASTALRAAGTHPFVPIEAERLRLLALAAWRARTDDPRADAATLDDLLARLEAPPMPADAHRFAADLRERRAFENTDAEGT